jgi:hypothetical protein
VGPTAPDRRGPRWLEVRPSWATTVGPFRCGGRRHPLHQDHQQQHHHHHRYLPCPLGLFFSQVMTTTLCRTIYKYYILLIRTRDLIIPFVPAYVGSSGTPDSTLEDQSGGSGAGLDDLAFDFDFFARYAVAGRAQRVAARRCATRVDSGGSRDAARRIAAARSER